MSTKNIVLVEDDENISTSLKISLESNGMIVTHYESAEQYLENAKKGSLYLLDINLPGMNGLDLCRKIRMSDSNTPIIFLTANQEESIAVEALSIGSQDFVRKPFSLAELIARIQLHLKAESHSEIIIGELVLNIETKKVFIQDREIKLTRNEFLLLSVFMDNLDKVYSRERLLDLMATSEDSSDRTVDTTLSRLKNKLKKNEVNCLEITSVYGEGYRSSAKK
jgi:DNA-binding response OmpR family regulator